MRRVKLSRIPQISGPVPLVWYLAPKHQHPGTYFSDPASKSGCLWPHVNVILCTFGRTRQFCRAVSVFSETLSALSQIDDVLIISKVRFINIRLLVSFGLVGADLSFTPGC